MKKFALSFHTRLTAMLMLAATAGCAPERADIPEAIELQPFASSPAPLSNSVDIAVVSEEIVSRTTPMHHQHLRVSDSLRGPE